MALKNDLLERLQILEENAVISKEVGDFSRDVVDMIFVKKPDASEAGANMFITHLAMAAQRVVDNTDEIPLDNALLEMVKQEPIYKDAVGFLQEILTKTDLIFPDTEKDFLAVHLCNLL